MKSFLVVALIAAVLSATGLMSMTMTPAVEAHHTTAGAAYWLKICKTVDAIITEPCGTLVSNHDPYGQGLSQDGWRVAKCVAGGVLLVSSGHADLLGYGPVVGCASNNLVNSLLGFLQ